ncbi:MAG: CarD family transcriptional regulator [Spirochaetales bacterium]|nr:CarD family transcriptional regulator [Spirochaetales bacterium]
MAKKMKNTFAENQYIVYPLQGVGKIEGLQERLFKGEATQYYVIYLEESEMTLMVPVDKAEELGIRPVISKVNANKALKALSEDDENVITDWKLRYQTNIDLLKTGDTINIAKVVRMLYRRSKLKELPILERKLYDNALALLRNELTISLELSKDDTDQVIFSTLEK